MFLVDDMFTTEAPLIVNPPPGPRVKKVLLEGGEKPLMPAPVIKYAKGVWIQDLDDNVIFDFISGRCTVNVGHRHPRIQSAIIEQMNKVTHGYIEERQVLLKKLDAILPLSGHGQAKTAFTLSGSASNDAAIKMARTITGKRGVICFAGAYHGTTYGALSISSYTPSMFKNYGRLNNVFRFPYPDYYHAPFENQSPDEIDDIIIGLIEQAFDTYMPPDDVAAVVFEPVAGDAGWLVPSKQFVQRLHRLMVENDILFVSEEVQTGFGRTGNWFCIENYGVAPDIVAMGKSMAGGAVAMAGVAVKQSTLERGEEFSHFHTMGIQPLGVVATVANIEVIESEDLTTKSRTNGKLMMKYLQDLTEDCDCLVNVRGVASLIGVEVSSKKLARQIAFDCYKNGIYLVAMGYRGTGVLRVAPPLISTEVQLENALDIIADVVHLKC